MNYENLVNGIKQKDNASIVEFYNEFYKDVYYVCYKITGNEKDAEDVTQETLFRAINKIDLLESVDGLPAWLRTIANNLSINYIKKNRKFDIADGCDVTEDDIFEDVTSAKKTPEEIVADKEVADILMTMINKLPEEQKITIFMFYYEELSVKEISEAMDCSEATVRSRINYAKKSLRKQVDELENKGVKLRCIAILPFLFTIYSFEKYAVASELSLPDIKTVYAKNNINKTGETSNMIKNNIANMALGTKIAIGAASALIVAGLVVGGISLANKDNGKTNNSTNVTQSADTSDNSDLGNNSDNNSDNKQENVEIQEVNLESLNKQMYNEYYEGVLYRGKIGVLKYYRSMQDNLHYAEGINANGYVCYIEADTKNLVCVNPSNDEEIYRIDMDDNYEIVYSNFGRNYLTLEVSENGENTRFLAYNLNNGEKILDLGMLDRENERPLIYPAGEGLVLMYYDIKESTRKVVSYSLYDVDGNITNPCSAELMAVLRPTCSYNYLEANTEDRKVKKYYRPDTMEQILTECKQIELVRRDANYELVRDYDTKELYLLSKEKVEKITEDIIVYHYQTNHMGDKEQITYGILLNNDKGRMLYSFDEKTYLVIGEHFTDNFIVNSSQTAMAYIGDDGKYYYFDMKNNVETELALSEGTMLMAVAKGKIVYATENDGEYVFGKLDIKTGEDIEIKSTGKLMEDCPYEVYRMDCSYDESEIVIFIDYNYYIEESDQWYGGLSYKISEIY